MFVTTYMCLRVLSLYSCMRLYRNNKKKSKFVSNYSVDRRRRFAFSMYTYLRNSCIFSSLSAQYGLNRILYISELLPEWFYHYFVTIMCYYSDGLASLKCVAIELITMNNIEKCAFYQYHERINVSCKFYFFMYIFGFICMFRCTMYAVEVDCIHYTQYI